MEQERICDCFYRVEPGARLPYPVLRTGREVLVALSDVLCDPGPMVAWWRRRAEAAAELRPRQFFDFRLYVHAGRSWRALDPQDEGSPWAQIQTLAGLLRRCGMAPFGAREPELLPVVVEGPDRYDWQWRMEPTDPPRLCLRQRRLCSGDPRRRELFALLCRGRRPLAAVPQPVRSVAERELAPGVEEEVVVLPLLPLLLQARETLQEMVLFHHVLFAATIEPLRRRLGSRPDGLHEVLSAHLAPYFLIEMSREELLARIRARYPHFCFDPSLQEAVLTQPEEQARLQALGVEVLGQEQIPPRRTLRLVGPEGGLVRCEPQPPRWELLQALDFLDAELAVHHYRVMAERWPEPQQWPPLVAQVAEQLDELAGTWRRPPRVQRADAQLFWRRQLWSVSAGARSTTALRSLRHALYHPPGGGASDLLIELMDEPLLALLFGPGHGADDILVFEVDPQDSSYFLNEWWDYLWVALVPMRQELVVLLGTASD
ncbi:MAG: hypothetical protein RMK29_11050 [Myxococcales bacterium]|nr:hypothetical protein [Myxococcota bacterium]MDW8282243.1 hypothetical protein [Myxococcales bacterium]